MVGTFGLLHDVIGCATRAYFVVVASSYHLRPLELGVAEFATLCDEQAHLPRGLPRGTLSSSTVPRFVKFQENVSLANNPRPLP
jgi:hypothetical protein